MKKILLALVVCLLLHTTYSNAQTTVKKVVLQAFWWDYTNNNYPNGWANYLAELAPRLKSMGIDAVWVPPTTKGNGGTNDVGYGPFDHYDLGDKFQKYNVRTRVGTKDELLRMIAVMHANGIEVIQDIVPNHVIGAGDTVTNAGIDPDAWDNKYKFFRYNSYSGTLQTGTIAEYRNKQGRFPKNWQNFHPNPSDNCNSGNICQEMFGPDVSYADGSNGQTLLAPVYDPNQLTYNPFNTSAVTGSSGNGYMRRHYREWLVWYKKQTGFDGIRMDAVKHFETSAAEDFLYNLQFGSGWTNGGNTMFAVGEYVGNSGELDGWTNAVQKRAGTFDFSLRSGIKDMVDNGFYNMASLPGTQQAERIQFIAGDNTYINRSTNFVNNHDTFRPILDANGNYTGWDSGNELGGGHIDPFSAKLPLSYAAIMAMDGNTQLFIEDLFNIGGTSKRYTHLPANTTDLPSRAALENIIWCHQSIGFKGGAYKVRSTAAGGNVYFSPDPDGAGCADLSRQEDLLIIERSNKAIIGLNDRSDACGWQSAWVDSDFPAGTVLKDYSGANGVATVTVQGDKRVYINVPPVNPGGGVWGYAIWAPAGATTYVPNRDPVTTQEWEMANDLGDSHCSSLGQGGSLPANSTRQRVVGKIFVAAGQQVSYTIYPELNGNNITFAIWNNNGTVLQENSAVISSGTPLTGSYTPAADGWLVMKVRNTTATQPAQKLFVKVSYTAPAVVNTLAAANAPATTVSIWTGNKNTTDATDCGNWEEGKIPSSTTSVIIPAYAQPFPVLSANLSVNNITIENGAVLQINAGNTLSVKGDWINNNTTTLSVCGKVEFSGTAVQQVSGSTAFCTLEINNPSSVNAVSNEEVVNELILTNGKYILNSNNLVLQSSCTITGGSAASYVQTTNSAAGGFLIQEITAGAKKFPVGNNNYTPITITNSGTVQNCRVRCFENVLANGLSGPAVSSQEKILKTWEITPLGAGAVAAIDFNWNAANHDAQFDKDKCYVAKNTGGVEGWVPVSAVVVASGADPYAIAAGGITSFSKFNIFSTSAALPVAITSFTGVEQQRKILLTWKVETESNLSHYEVEKSTDGIHFNRIGSVDAKGNSTYNFTDPGFSKASWYRLVMADRDGAKRYSAVIFFDINDAQHSFLITPNPVTDKVKLSARGQMTGGLIYSQLSNNAGAVVFRQTGNLEMAEQKLNSVITALPAGVYYIKLVTQINSQVLKFIKQ